MAASYLFLFGGFAAVHGLLALVRFRRPSVLAMVFFFSGWITMELALLHLLWQVPVVAALVAFGGLDRPIGWGGLGLTAASWAAFAVAWWRMAHAGAAVVEALGDLTPRSSTVPETPSRWFGPTVYRRPDVVVERDLAYGPDGRHRLDVYRRHDRPADAPTVVTVHGGGWMRGSKDRQAQPLAWRLAAEGWTVAAVNYRLSPHATFPEHVIDVKRAVGWLRDHAPDHGIDRDRLALSGGSAGAHIAAIAALTPGRSDLQPGFEQADTTVRACVPFYGIYDIAPDRQPVAGGALLGPIMVRHVMKTAAGEDVEGWDLASPITLVTPDAPPFLVVHGSLDTVLLVEGARRFVDRFGTVGAEARLLEIPGAQHAFDVFRTPRSDAVVDATIRWLAAHVAPNAVSAPVPA